MVGSASRAARVDACPRTRHQRRKIRIVVFRAWKVALRWDRSGANGRLLFIWEETGGPPLDGAPKRRGFGSTLLGSLVQQLGGTIESIGKQARLRCAITIAADHFSIPPAAFTQIIERQPGSLAPGASELSTDRADPVAAKKSWISPDRQRQKLLSRRRAAMTVRQAFQEAVLPSRLFMRRRGEHPIGLGWRKLHSPGAGW